VWKRKESKVNEREKGIANVDDLLHSSAEQKPPRSARVSRLLIMYSILSRSQKKKKISINGYWTTCAPLLTHKIQRNVHTVV